VLRLSSLGDVVLTSSFLRSVHQLFPQAAIDFVVRDDLQEVAQALPSVSNVIPVPRKSSLWALLRLAKELAATEYDHVFDLHRSLRSRILVRHMHQQLRGGFDKQSLARWLLIQTHRDYYAHLGGTKTLRERMLQPLQRMGLQPTLHPSRLVLPASAREQAQQLMNPTNERQSAWIALAPGALWASKQWPSSRYRELAEQLLAKETHRLILVGGSREQELCAGIAAGLSPRVLNVAGQLDIPQTAAVLQRCQYAVVNDSGLSHIAEAVGCPVLALFGPTSPRFGYAPQLPTSRFLYKSPECSPCSKNGARPCHRPTHECMLQIEISEVLGIAEQFPARDDSR